MAGKNVFITGASGMLGSSLVKYFKKRYTIVGNTHRIDITDKMQLHAALDDCKPELIIHTAAYTNVDDCERTPDKAFKINTIGTQSLVNYCVGKDIMFIYISSTGIYGDYKDGAYTEFDPVRPTTVHHKSKYEGERVVINHLSKFLILRTGWLYGGEKEHAKNFVYKRYLESLNNKIMFSDDSQTGNPTYILNLCQQIEVLIDKKHYGIFNCINQGEHVSRFQYVAKIIEYFDTNCEVKKGDATLFQRTAPVSLNETAINYKLNLLGINVMHNWEVALKSYVKNLKNTL